MWGCGFGRVTVQAFFTCASGCWGSYSSPVLTLTQDHMSSGHNKLCLISNGETQHLILPNPTQTVSDCLLALIPCRDICGGRGRREVVIFDVKVVSGDSDKAWILFSKVLSTLAILGEIPHCCTTMVQVHQWK